MLVTLFSDASICADTGIAGWAAWAKCDRGTVRGDGAFRRTTRDSAVAEAMAAVNGLVIADRKGLIHEGDAILVQTDNNAVMQVLEGTARRGIRAKEAPGPGFKEMRGAKRQCEAELRCLEDSANDDPSRSERIAELQREIRRIKGEIRSRDKHISGLKAVADRRNDEIREIAAIYAALIERLGVTVRWRHCKGHKGLETKRSAVNTGCDERARQRMQDARREHLRRQANISRPAQAEELPLAA